MVKHKYKETSAVLGWYLVCLAVLFGFKPTSALADVGNPNLTVMEVPVGLIGPRAAADYRDWSLRTQLVLLRLAGSNCVTEKYFYAVLGDKSDAVEIARALGAGKKFQVVSYSRTALRQVCNDDFASNYLVKKIVFKSPVPNFERQLNIDTSVYTNVMIRPEYTSGQNYTTTEVDIIYPKLFKFSGEDFQLRVAVNQKLNGVDCCLVFDK